MKKINDVCIFPFLAHIKFALQFLTRFAPLFILFWCHLHDSDCHLQNSSSAMKPNNVCDTIKWKVSTLSLKKKKVQGFPFLASEGETWWARRGLPHLEQLMFVVWPGGRIYWPPACSLCFCKIILIFMARTDRAPFTTQPSDVWWARTNEATSGLILQGGNSFIILGAWSIWKHHNRCVFGGRPPVWLKSWSQLGRSAGRSSWDWCLKWPRTNCLDFRESSI